MTRTTPPRPADITAVVPQLALPARKATRSHPRPGSPSAGDSPVGGPLPWSAAEPWPHCAGPHALDGPNPAVPLADVRLKRRIGPAAYGRSTTPQERETLGRIDPRPDRPTTEPPVAQPCDGSDSPYAPAPQEFYLNASSVAPGWEVGGWAPWSLTDPVPRFCASCDTRMEPLPTTATTEWDAGSRSWIPYEDRAAASSTGYGCPDPRKPTAVQIGPTVSAANPSWSWAALSRRPARHLSPCLRREVPPALPNRPDPQRLRIASTLTQCNDQIDLTLR